MAYGMDQGMPILEKVENEKRVECLIAFIVTRKFHLMFANQFNQSLFLVFTWVQ